LYGDVAMDFPRFTRAVTTLKREGLDFPSKKANSHSINKLQYP
jgi:hypothetical protein